MSRSRAALVVLLAALVDAVAVIVASGYLSIASLPNWPVAIGLHLTVVVACGVVAAWFARNRDGGVLTMVGLALVLVLVAPISGALAVAAMLATFSSSRASSSNASAFTIGSPLVRRRITSPDEPLAESLRQNHLAAVRGAGPILHRDRSPAALTVLRQLQHHPDPRTQLQAQAALATIGETADRQLAALRRDSVHSSDARRHLASLLHLLVTSRLRDRRESAALLDEAVGHLEQVLKTTPEDIESLHLLGRCQLTREQPSGVPALIEKLRSLPDGGHFADRLETDLRGARGQWRKAADILRRQGPRGSTAAHRFWFFPPPSNPSTLGAAHLS